MDFTNVLIVLFVLLIGIGLGIHLGFQVVRSLFANAAHAIKDVGKSCKKTFKKK